MKKIVVGAILAAAATMLTAPATASADTTVYGEGSRIAVTNDSGDTMACTLGPVGVGADGVARAFIAYHCANGADVGTPVNAVVNNEAGPRIGTIDKLAEFTDYTRQDVALVKFDRKVGVSTDVLGPGGKNYPLAGVLGANDLYAMLPTLCGTGGISGFRCGEVDAHGRGLPWISIDTQSRPGDSGSGYFAYSDGKAYAVAVTSTGDGRPGTTVDPIADLAKKWNVTLRDPGLN